MQTLAPSDEQTGRPRSYGVKEDENFWYSYSPRGAVTKSPKGSAEQYYWFLTHVVLYGEKGQNTMYSTAFPHGRGNVDTKPPTRQTPETEFEKASGIGMTNIYAVADSELPDSVRGQIWDKGSHGLIVPTLNIYMNKKIEEKRLKDLAEEERLARELALIRPTAKPKKETVFVAPPEIIENPLSYSPLMIAGVIAVVVILLLKRRRA